MNRLQKLYDAGIRFDLSARQGTGVLSTQWNLDGAVYGECRGYACSWPQAIDDLWQAAKRAYPDAECFKEEV